MAVAAVDAVVFAVVFVAVVVLAFVCVAVGGRRGAGESANGNDAEAAFFFDSPGSPGSPGSPESPGLSPELSGELGAGCG